MTESQKLWAKRGFVALVILAAAGSCLYAKQMQWDRDVAKTNLTAALDTTRVYVVDSITTAYSRLVQQRDIDMAMLHDSLAGLVTAFEDRGVEHVRVVERFTVTVDSLTERNTELERDLITLARDSTAYRVVHITQRDSASPIEVDLYLSVPLDTLLPVDIEYARFRVPDIVVGAGIGCTRAKDAVVSLQGPSWVTLTLDERQTVVDPEVCHGRRPSIAVELFKPGFGKALWAGAGLAIGYVLGGGGAEANVYVNPQRVQVRLGELYWR